jgi:hypothetical protein
MISALRPPVAQAQVAQAQASRRMSTPEDLRELAADFAIAAANGRTAISHLEFADAFAAAGAGMRRTLQAALDCGQALSRMHESENYRDSYGSWAALCRAAGIPRTTTYRLMKIEEPGPADIAELPEEEAPLIDGPFARLREMLAVSASSARLDHDDAKRPAAPRDAVWVERQAVTLARWFEGHERADAARPHLDALVELAKTA